MDKVSWYHENTSTPTFCGVSMAHARAQVPDTTGNCQERFISKNMVSPELQQAQCNSVQSRCDFCGHQDARRSSRGELQTQRCWRPLCPAASWTPLAESAGDDAEGDQIHCSFRMSATRTTWRWRNVMAGKASWNQRFRCV